MGSNRARRMLKHMNRDERDRLRELAREFTDDQDFIGEPEELIVQAGLATANGSSPDGTEKKD